jgi:selenocysteine-specific elongation factor
MQMFKKPVEHAVQGDRIGICLTQFDPRQLERGIACKPGYVPTITAGIISVHKIKYYKGNINTKAKFHISIGHETVMAKLSFFGSVQDASGAANYNAFDFEREYKFQDELLRDLQSDSQVHEMPVKQFALL